MKTKVDANSVFTPDRVSLMERLLEINSSIKTLESEKQVLVEQIKKDMQNANITDVNVNGSTLSLTESARRTVTKSTKDKFIAELVAMNKRHLIQYEITPDLDGIFAEVDAGNITKEFVDMYVKVVPVVTLRCT